MKKKIFLISMIMIFVVSIMNSQTRYGKRLSFQYFYHELTPMGHWMEIDDNLFAWQPDYMGRNWKPYSVGRWEWSDDGWYWDSYENFGWITYHYGRWINDFNHGWLWIPGYQWAPAWVEWRYDSRFIGWAPLSPYADFRFDVGIHFSMDYESPYSDWNFVYYDHFDNPNLNHYFVASSKTRDFFRKTKYRTNYRSYHGRIINNGVSREYIQKISGKRIKKRNMKIYKSRDEYFNRRNKDSDNIGIYRPTDRDLSRFSKTDRVFAEKNRSSEIDTRKFFNDKHNRSNVGVIKDYSSYRNGNYRDDEFRKSSRKNYKERSSSKSNRITRKRSENSREYRESTREKGKTHNNSKVRTR